VQTGVATATLTSALRCCRSSIRSSLPYRCFEPRQVVIVGRKHPLANKSRPPSRNYGAGRSRALRPAPVAARSPIRCSQGWRLSADPRRVKCGRVSEAHHSHWVWRRDRASLLRTHRARERHPCMQCACAVERCCKRRACGTARRDDRALDIFRSVCLRLRGPKLRTINLDNVERRFLSRYRSGRE